MTRFRFSFVLAAALAFLGLSSTVAQAQISGSKAVSAQIQRAWLGNDRILVEVFIDNIERPGNDPNKASSYPYGEHYANRLGDVVPFRIRVFCLLDPNQPTDVQTVKSLPGSKALEKIELDFANLKAGRLTLEQDPDNDPDWVFAKPAALGPNEKPLELPAQPRLVTIKTADGEEQDAELWDIRAFVQTRRRPEPMNLWAEFKYCATLDANGQREWQRAETPDFELDGSYTGDKSRDLETGNTNLIEEQRPLTLSLIFLATGATMLALPLGLFLARGIQRLLASRGHAEAFTPAHVWSIFDPILTAAYREKGDKRGYLLKRDDVVTIVATFKNFLGFNGSAAQFKGQIAEYRNGEDIYEILNTLEYHVLERGEKVSAKRYLELMESIEKLCPRP